MNSLFLSLRPIKSCSIEQSLVPLMSSSELFVVSYEEKPRSLIRLFDGDCRQLISLHLPMYLLDICYSAHLHSFVFLSQKSLFQFDPLVGHVEPIDDYHLLKEDRSMSSICSTNDQRLFILYRFGEYLDTYPKGKRIWKQRHLCDSIREDIFLIRSSKGQSNFSHFFLWFSFLICSGDLSVLAMLIVEWNGVWRIDIYSLALQKLRQGFRFTNWTPDTWMSECSPDNLWHIGGKRHFIINANGQPIHSRAEHLHSHINNITWLSNNQQKNIKMIVTRANQLLTFLK